jgi:phosphoglycerate dehydrogenase-like enzyme
MAVENQTFTVAVFQDKGFPTIDVEDDRVRLEMAQTVEAFSRVIGEADAVLFASLRGPLLRQAWPQRHHIRWLQVASVGVDAVLFPELVASDVVLTNTKGVLDDPMAEYTIALMLALGKDLPRTLELQRERTWKFREPALMRGRRVLVVGVGGIGTAIGKYAAAIGMEVVGVGRRARTAGPPFGRIAGASELPRLVPEADYVVLAVPLTSQTRGIFSGELIGKMRPSAFLINIARGQVVDEAALIKALRERRIAGAALDVFQTEPLPPEHPFWALPNVIVSPHMSADVPESTQWTIDLFVKNLDRFRRGEPLLNVVDKRLGFVTTQ